MSSTGGRETIWSRKAAGKDPYNRGRGIAFAVGEKPETPEGDFAANRGTPRSVPYSFSSSRTETRETGSRSGGRWHPGGVLVSRFDRGSVRSIIRDVVLTTTSYHTDDNDRNNFIQRTSINGMLKKVHRSFKGQCSKSRFVRTNSVGYFFGKEGIGFSNISHEGPTGHTGIFGDQDGLGGLPSLRRTWGKTWWKHALFFSTIGPYAPHRPSALPLSGTGSRLPLGIPTAFFAKLLHPSLVHPAVQNDLLIILLRQTQFHAGSQPALPT